MRNVMVADGLRVHICPKVGTASISHAFHQVPYRNTFPDEAGGEFRFMPVRHPLDRIVSAWAYFCNAETPHEISSQPGLLGMGYYFGMPFTEFLDICLKRHDENPHTRTQVQFAGPHPFDWLCPLDDLPDAWEVMRERFDYLKPLVHNHRSHRTVWEKYYDEEMRERAERVFADDLSLFARAHSEAPF